MKNCSKKLKSLHSPYFLTLLSLTLSNYKTLKMALLLERLLNSDLNIMSRNELNLQNSLRGNFERSTSRLLNNKKILQIKTLRIKPKVSNQNLNLSF